MVASVEGSVEALRLRCWREGVEVEVSALCGDMMVVGWGIGDGCRFCGIGDGGDCFCKI